MKNGLLEAQNTAKEGDYIVRNPDGEEYTISAKKFASNYAQKGGGKQDENGFEDYEPTGGPMCMVPVTEDIVIEAPWGGPMPIEKGGVLAYAGDNDIYGIQGPELKNYSLCDDNGILLDAKPEPPKPSLQCRCQCD